MTLDAHALSAIAEVQAIDRLIAGFPRHPGQWNRPHEADAELVALVPDLHLASTIDGVADEIALGYYRDMYTAGWVLVMANLSDLAAVGAAPIGLMLALTLSGSAADPRLLEGINAALAASGTAVLGGDLNHGGEAHLTACALGLVAGAPVGRTGIRPGDDLWATGPLGAGNALAICRMLGLPEALAPESGFRPVARVAEGQALRPHARAMMDTSDGFMSTVDHLARLNGVGFRLDFDMDALVAPGPLAAFRGAGLPAWPLLCGEHGEYELLVAAAPEAAGAIREAAPAARRVGVATADPGIALAMPDGREVAFDGGFIRNLPARTGGDWAAYAREFQAYGAGLGLA